MFSFSSIQMLLIGVGVVAASTAALSHYLNLRNDLDDARAAYQDAIQEVTKTQILYEAEHRALEDYKQHVDAMERVVLRYREMERENSRKLSEIRERIDDAAKSLCPAGDQLAVTDSGVYQLFPSKPDNRDKDD